MFRKNLPRFFLKEKMLWQFAAACLFFLVSRMVIFQNTFYLFLIWNLFLGWIPLWCAQITFRYQRTTRPLLLLIPGALWLLFLPNAPYLVTDLIYLRFSTPWSLVLDIFMLGSFAMLGFFLGIYSLEIMKSIVGLRWGSLASSYFMVAAAFLSGFAIFLGRFLRWNSWDILTNPLGLLEAIMNVLIHPFENPEMIATTLFYGLAMVGASILFGAYVEFRAPVQIIKS